MLGDLKAKRSWAVHSVTVSQWTGLRLAMEESYNHLNSIHNIGRPTVADLASLALTEC